MNLKTKLKIREQIILIIPRAKILQTAQIVQTVLKITAAINPAITARIWTADINSFWKKVILAEELICV